MGGGLGLVWLPGDSILSLGFDELGLIEGGVDTFSWEEGTWAFLGDFGSTSNSGNSSSIWDFFKVPWSGSVVAPLVPFGPAASAGAGLTFAYNPMTDTGCAGLAAGAMVPAGGRAAAVGPLTVGNLGNADNILAGEVCSPVRNHQIQPWVYKW